MNYFQEKQRFLIVTTLIMSFCFAGWNALLNNFAVEAANFTGAEIGMLQSLREVPGFLAFTAVFVLLVISEQILALLSLCLLILGVTLTGFFPTEYGLYATTVLMSIGFHYFETINNSLTLQWLDKSETPRVMGKLISYRSFAALFVYGLIWVMVTLLDMPFKWMYVVIGVIGAVLLLWMIAQHKKIPEHTTQHKKLILRKRYSLYYLLTFLSGARRQIFIVFAGFLMVEKFNYDASDIAVLFIANHLLNLYIAPKIGHWIGRVGERKALTVEYIGLIIVFVGYGLVEDHMVAAGLYLIDHMFFAMAIAIKTYFQKIADPADIAASSGVSFTINHIAAVIIPALFGLIWLYDHSLVFFLGALMAFMSLVSCQWIVIEHEPETKAQPVS